MTEKSPAKGLPSDNPSGAGRPTRANAQARARALALIDGRSPVDVSQSDYEQAKRELTGQSGLAQQEAMLDVPSENGGQSSREAARRTKSAKLPK